MSTSDLIIDRLYEVTFKDDEDETLDRRMVVANGLPQALVKIQNWAKIYFESTPVRVFSIIEQDEELIQ